MKKTSFFVFLLAIVSTLIFSRCQGFDNETTEVLPLGISLKAPKGDIIASSLSELEKWGKEIAGEKFEASSDFKVTEVKYYNVKDSYVAYIQLETTDGMKLSYLLSDRPLKIETSELIYKPALENRNSGKWVVTCSGLACCTPNFNLQTNTASCPCQNSDGSNNINKSSSCKMTVTTVSSN